MVIFLKKYLKSASLACVTFHFNLTPRCINNRPILAEIKKLLPVKVSHDFDPKTKGWIIAGIILLIVTAWVYR
jgi:hypothetical protein